MSDTVNVFDRIDITVAGERLTARPTDFTYDDKGEAVRAIRYETTCPKCGNMIDFDAEVVWHQDDQDHVACANGQCAASKIQRPVLVTVPALEEVLKPVIVAKPVTKLKPKSEPVKQKVPVSTGQIEQHRTSPEVATLSTRMMQAIMKEEDAKAIASMSQPVPVVPTVPVKQLEPTITVKPEGQIVEEPNKAVATGVRVPDRGCPFIDPIAEGDYTVEIMVYCQACSAAGGADKPVYHAPPVCEATVSAVPVVEAKATIEGVDLPGQR